MNANVGGRDFSLTCFYCLKTVVPACLFSPVGYGVQKNMSYGTGVASTGLSTSQYRSVRTGLKRGNPDL